MKFKHTLVLAAILAAGSASAVTITADFTNLGTVYQLTDGQLSNTNTVGAVDVTGLFMTNVATAINYWQNAVLLPWNTTFSFILAPLGSAVGDNSIQSFDASNRPTSSILRTDSFDPSNPTVNAIPFFLDPTPADNTEFSISSTSTSLGGSMVNVSRFGPALGAPASNGYDILSLFLHEIEHGLGFSGGTTRFDATLNPAGDLVVPTSVTGFSSDFVVPLSGTHIDGVTQGGLFNNTSIALPGFGVGERALLTGVDIYSICAIQQCTPDQLNTNPSAVSAIPEPSTVMLFLASAPILLGLARRRKQARA